jgi:hypothetical protein
MLVFVVDNPNLKKKGVVHRSCWGLRRQPPHHYSTMFQKSSSLALSVRYLRLMEWRGAASGL